MKRRVIGLAVVAGIAVLAVVAWATTRSPSPTVDAKRSATTLMARCSADNAGVEPCVRKDLEQVLTRDGQAAAFALLTLVASSPALAGKDHGLAHHMGRLSYTAAGIPSRALAECPETMGSGCTHGVIEEYFKEKGPEASVVGLCQDAGSGGAYQGRQCWHGVGHGLLMANNYDWIAAVKPCAAIPEYMDRVNCSSGVFMQNFMGDTGMAMEMDMGGGEMMHHEAPTRPRLKADDLLYPCNKVTGNEAQIGCWQMQPFVVLLLTKGDFTKAFWACAQSGEFAVMCDEGVGQAAGA